MKNKTFITIAVCMLFMLAGFSAFAGERVYIREYTYTAFVWQNGVTKKADFKGSQWERDSGREENLKNFATLLEGYLTQGFKIVSVVNKGEVANSGPLTEYILEKP
jgi:hypothetical protein